MKNMILTVVMTCVVIGVSAQKMASEQSLKDLDSLCQQVSVLNQKIASLRQKKADLENELKQLGDGQENPPVAPPIIEHPTESPSAPGEQPRENENKLPIDDGNDVKNPADDNKSSDVDNPAEGGKGFGSPFNDSGKRGEIKNKTTDDGTIIANSKRKGKK